MEDNNNKDIDNKFNNSNQGISVEQVFDVIEIGGPKGKEPTRYGVETPEWEVKGRVSDF
jgi:hypothetical protein